MITYKDHHFILESKDLNYMIHLLPTGHLEHLYFGRKLKDTNYEPLHTKITAGMGSTVEYENDQGKLFLELYPLEYSGIGKGDFRLSPLEMKMPDGSFVSDFIYISHDIQKGILPFPELPQAKGDDEDVETLIIHLEDHHAKQSLDLIYTVFETSNVITRRVKLTNHHETPVMIRKIMSLMFDLKSFQYDLYTFDGGWIKEAGKHKRELSYGTYINESVTGSSSNRHQPGIILAKKGTTENQGVCIGLNLVYSGNHYEAIQINTFGHMRVMTGIHPHTFEWELKSNESFVTPEAVLTYSDQGLNALSKNFHHFVNHHIIPKTFQFKERPIAFNSWEAFYFDFNERKLMKLAKDAKKLGAELFVLDDGWFSSRNDDHQGLGDYDVNLKKLPSGLKGLSHKINQLGLSFGLWFEPEMVNPKSKLYEHHPSYAVKIEGRTPALGRNQLVLDLCQEEVRTYIKENIKKILSESNISYIKWDMNRHITDMYSKSLTHQGAFFHTYMLGLYDILNDIVSSFPNVLLETCSSGGNRFDLGMLCFGAQIWASDNTDPISRLNIQEGLSYLYPLSTISCHVSLAPHAQTLRDTPLSTRFNVASFGVLGYELNLSYLAPYEKKVIKTHIETYKKHRMLFQYGDFYRYPKKAHQMFFQVSLSDEHMFGYYQTKQEPSPELETIEIHHLKDEVIYEIHKIEERLGLSRFGHLISHALPIHLDPNGMIMHMIKKRYTLKQADINFQASGKLLKHGFSPKQQFSGTYYNEHTRLLGDFGSELYHMKEVS